MLWPLQLSTIIKKAAIAKAKFTAYDTDLFSTPAATILQLKQRGIKVRLLGSVIAWPHKKLPRLATLSVGSHFLCLNIGHD